MTERRIEEVLIATANEGKVRELERIIRSMSSVRVLSLKEYPLVTPPEERGRTFRENAATKAIYYSRLTGKPCLAEDSGLVVDALGGAPGVFSSRFAGTGASDEDNILRLLSELAGKPQPWTARFICCAVCAFEGEVVAEAEGTLEGEIVPERRGRGGFGYDPVFFVPPLRRTAAELTLEEKNRVSHRREAVEKLFTELKSSGMLSS